MVQKITPKPNTFYHKQDLVADTGVIPTYGDVYPGMSATFTLESNPATTYLLAESNIVSPNDYVYGEGKVNEMYVSIYANDVQQTNPQTAPYVDIFNLRENLSITEGNHTITSGTTGFITQFTSYYDTGMPWLSENFDGTEKHLFNITPRNRPGELRFYFNYKISLRALWPHLRNFYYAERYQDYQNETEDAGFIDSTVEWGKTIWDAAWNEIEVNTGVESNGLVWPFIGEGMFNINTPTNTSGLLGETFDAEVKLIKNRSGYYYPDLDPVLAERNATTNAITDAAKSMSKPLWYWTKIGAYKTTQGGSEISIGMTDYFDDTYVATMDSSNSIFSDVFMDGDVRDIKDQTLEGPGDSDRFLAYAYANLINTDSYSEGQSSRIKLFWENYSGSLTGNDAKQIANPFGTESNTCVSQDAVASIHGIPQPWVYDASTPDLVSGTAAFAPEIEIIFKIKQMDRAPLYVGSSNLNGGNGFPSLERSFNIIGGARAPTGDETQISDYSEAYWSTNGYKALMMCTGASVNGVDMVEVFGDTADFGRDVHGKMWYEGGISDNYHTQLPKGKWIRARIKFQQSSKGNASPIMMYFPDELESTGEIKNIELKASAWAGISSWYNHLTFWVNNQRSMNVAGGSTTSHINCHYAADAIINDDKQVDVLLDSLAFFNWNLQTKNNTVCNQNPVAGLINVPSTYATPQSIFISGNTGSPSNEPAPKVTRTTTSGNCDNMYAQPTVPIATYLNFGFDVSGTSPNYRGWFKKGMNFMFNDFSTIDAQNVAEVPDKLIRAKTFGQNTYPFADYEGWWTQPTDGAVRVSSSALPGGGIELGGASNMVDGFTQKGYLHISGQSYTPGMSSWRATGNPFACARILNVEENGTVITVDNDNIFSLPPETRYVVDGVGPIGTNIGTISGAALSVGYNASGANGPITASKLSDGRIKLSRSILRDDNNTKYTYDIANRTFGRANFKISPYKYWLVVAILNASGSEATEWGEWWNQNGYFVEPKYNADVGRGESRTYNRMIPVSGGSTAGTTFNESLFSDGVYTNRQSLSLLDVNNSVVNLTTDYGFGALSQNPDDNASISEGGVGFMGRDKLVSGSNYVNISNYIPISRPKEGAKFNFMIKPTYDSTTLAGYHININTDDATTNPLQVLYGISDPLPIVNNLTVTSGFDPDTVDPNEFTSTASNVTFNWEEETEDTWYRMLFVDSQHIQNKYHRTNFWAPLNDLPPDSTIPVTPSTFGYYTSAADQTKTSFNVSGNTKPDIEGLQGYGAKFDGTGDYLVTTDVIPLAVSADKYSWVGHCTPSAVNGGIFDVYSNSPSDFTIELSSSRIKVYHSGSNKTLTSTNIFDCDGVQPLQIAVTYDKTAQANNWKLYVNNSLEDTQDYTTGNITISGNVFIGASGTSATAGSNHFNGIIEEIISYSGNCIHFPNNPAQYKFNTTTLDDVVTGTTANTSINHTARLFVMDYHNVRGKGITEVSRTNTASWKVTSI